MCPHTFGQWYVFTFLYLLTYFPQSLLLNPIEKVPFTPLIEDLRPSAPHILQAVLRHGADVGDDQGLTCHSGQCLTDTVKVSLSLCCTVHTAHSLFIVYSTFVLQRCVLYSRCSTLTYSVWKNKQFYSCVFRASLQQSVFFSKVFSIQWTHWRQYLM